LVSPCRSFCTLALAALQRYFQANPGSRDIPLPLARLDREHMMKSRIAVKWTVLVCAGGIVAACTAEGPREGLAATDPYEPFNRSMLNVNKSLDRYALRPAAQAYDFAAPTTLQFIIGNGLDYLETPIHFANYLMQGDIDRSLETLGRFTINTVIGGLGMLDPATEFGLPRQETDFGITLGRWGVGEGPYLVLPLLGPTTGRDLPSFVVDRALYPLTYVGPFTALDGLGPAVTATDYIDTRNRNFDLIDELFYNTEDTYVTLRAAYLQRRRAQIAGEEGEIENLPDIFDEEAGEEATPSE
jgi:phospholipid-binding lipoprotein MlaA